MAPAPTTPRPTQNQVAPLEDFCAVRFWTSLPACLSALRAFFMAFLSPVMRATASSKPLGVCFAARTPATDEAVAPAFAAASRVRFSAESA